jgi:perosamine synthetase
VCYEPPVLRSPQRVAAPVASTAAVSDEPIPLSSPYLDEGEERAVLDVLRSGRLSLGPMVDELERLLAERVGAPFVAAVSSGTAGLHLSAKLARIGPGDEVITTPLSFIASANCILYEGATPIFVDVDRRTLNLDPAAVEAAVTPRTSALVTVDLFGYPAEYATLAAIADRHGLALVEDAAEALGAVYRGCPIGSLGHPAVFAFYANKQMTTGEGGAVALASEKEWELVKSLSNQGRTDRGDTFTHSRLGYNYRLDELSAAVGVAQLEKLGEILGQRAAVAARYEALLAGLDAVTTLCSDDADHVRSWFVYVVFVRPPLERDVVISRLAASGVSAKPYLPAIHLQPLYAERFGFRNGMFPIAEAAGASGIALPFHTALTEGEQERVVAALAHAVRTP